MKLIAVATVLLWIGVFVVSYTYIGYGILLLVISKIKKPFPIRVVPEDGQLPFVTILIAAYNEESLIAGKIRNTLGLDYPAQKLSVVIVTDGSSDATPEVARGFENVKVFHAPDRKGKIHAVNRVMQHVTTPIAVYSDANTSLNSDALKKIVRHYADENVGGVAGEKRIAEKKEDNASGSGEGLYWKYESFLKQKDSDIYSVVGAAGELFSIRTELYEEPAADMIIEDFYISLKIAMQGYRFIYEPQACAVETASASVKEEWKRKVRIAAGGFQAMGRLLPLLNIFRYGWLSFQYVSHRVLRWTLAPICLAVILICSIILAANGVLTYTAILTAQFVFYAFAGLGYLLQDRKIAIRGFFVPYYFVVMNLAVYFGWFRFIRGKQSVVWERATRAENTPS